MTEEPTTSGSRSVAGADGAQIRCSWMSDEFMLDYELPRPITAEQTVFVALRADRQNGSAILPYTEHQEGSTVFLPFKAHALYELRRSSAGAVDVFVRRFENLSWDDLIPAPEARGEVNGATITLRIPLIPRIRHSLSFVTYAKNFAGAMSWGSLFGCSDAATPAGQGDKYVAHYLHGVFGSAVKMPFSINSRLDHDSQKVRIYQLFVRLFGNTNGTRKPNGTINENGVGKFSDINESAIASLKQMGFTHIWLTGVLQQATGTDYSQIGAPADEPDLLKGLAGSPYAIKDYFDLCPDYAQKPAERLPEFRALLERLHSAGLKAIIDFVPNHVARCYSSDVQPDLHFGSKGQEGRGDDITKFFDPGNNFFYLTPGSDGPPLRLPTWKDGQPLSATCQLAGQNCDGFFEGERDLGRVTGNNVTSWTPQLGDWYETVKLNYGFDFSDPTQKRREYPHAGAPDKAVPDTWVKMDGVIDYWQSVGVDGFRCDMAHMIPPEFWSWEIERARSRRPDVYFMAEAYDDDPAKVPGSDPIVAGLNHGRGNVMFGLLNAGFNAVYGAPVYRALKKIYDGPGWANDIDDAVGDEFIFHNSVHYAENHDEVRLAASSQWGGHGMKVGRPVAAILYGISRGPVLLYNGQEVGEPGAGREGFGGDDARTSIFGYWSMPELVKWNNDHTYDGAGLSGEQRS
ncbi:MAG: hypothetical protein H0U99_05285, partial [Chthoniobacterales bacterium]|nr:hypothetical protein [Chthoniobacterales bacterium]